MLYEKLSPSFGPCVGTVVSIWYNGKEALLSCFFSSRPRLVAAEWEIGLDLKLQVDQAENATVRLLVAIVPYFRGPSVVTSLQLSGWGRVGWVRGHVGVWRWLPKEWQASSWFRSHVNLTKFFLNCADLSESFSAFGKGMEAYSWYIQFLY